MARVLVGSFSPMSVVAHAAKLSWIHTTLKTDHGKREKITHDGMMCYTRIRGGEMGLARFGFDASEDTLLAVPMMKNNVQERIRQVYTQSQADDNNSRDEEWKLAGVNTRLDVRIGL